MTYFLWNNSYKTIKNNLVVCRCNKLNETHKQNRTSTTQFYVGKGSFIDDLNQGAKIQIFTHRTVISHHTATISRSLRFSSQRKFSALSLSLMFQNRKTLKKKNSAVIFNYHIRCCHISINPQHQSNDYFISFFQPIKLQLIQTHLFSTGWIKWDNTWSHQQKSNLLDGNNQIPASYPWSYHNK